jgi:hypothetical protein
MHVARNTSSPAQRPTARLARVFNPVSADPMDPAILPHSKKRNGHDPKIKKLPRSTNQCRDCEAAGRKLLIVAYDADGAVAFKNCVGNIVDTA